MRRLLSYQRKYGVAEGTQMFHRLQREAALTSAHARQLKRLRLQAMARELHVVH
jgi:hypothetical protein